MQKLIIASHNEGKIREFRALLADFDFEILSLTDISYLENINETGSTFAENAQIKATNIFRFHPQAYVLADDSGLCVPALDGAPGVYSARFAGENSSYSEKFTLLWQMLAERKVPPTAWQAYFHADLCLVTPRGDIFHYDGDFYGELLAEPRGDQGFGYDPIFYVPEYGQTAAMMPLELKNKISHRGIALAKLKADLPRVLALQ